MSNLALLVTRSLSFLPYEPQPLSLPPVPAGFVDAACVASCAAFMPRAFEPAGKAYHVAMLAKARALVGKASGSSDPTGPASGAGADNPRQQVSRVKAPKIKVPTLEQCEEGNLYDILGLGEQGCDATDEEIRRNYRKLILLIHPDKAGGGSTPKKGRSTEDDTDPRFTAVSKAWDTLSNPVKRREYDSQFEFDEDIPSGKESLKTDEAFFELYGPVFRRNARFSKTTPVPRLGDSSTPIEKVLAFYDFWYRFQSWREMQGDDEHNLDEADNREERRWMQQQNEKQRRKLRAAEGKRVLLLVKRARANDPRVQRYEAQQKADQEAAKAAKKAEAAAKAKVEADAKAAQEEAAKVAKEQAKASKKAMKEAKRIARKRARFALKPLLAQGTIASCDVDEWIQAFTDIGELSAVADRMGSPADPDKASKDPEAPARLDLEQVLRVYMEELEGMKKEEAAAVERQKERIQAAAGGAGGGKRGGSQMPWTAQELALLAKGVVKFPAGTKARWQLIAEYVNSARLPSHTRNKEECIARAMSVTSADKAAPVAEPAAAAAAAPKAEEEAKAGSSSGAATGGAAAAGAKSKGGAEGGSPGKGKGGKGESGDKKKKEGAGVWTSEQQKAMLAALKKYPATMDKNERWASIAGEVEGKSKKDCFARFKEIRAELKKQREGKAAK